MLAAFVAGCNPGATEGSRALYELERLAFVPKAPCKLRGYEGLPFADCSLERAIVIDLYEVTRRDYLHYYPRVRTENGLGFGASRQDHDPNQLDWPAFLSCHEARALGEKRGMRLLRAREWIHVAVGRRSYRYPQGGARTSVANTHELGLGTPTAVGTFEMGASRPFGCYDMLGNVWEWVDDAVPGYQDRMVGSSVGTEPAGDDGRVSVMGGSYQTRVRQTFGERIGGEGPLLRFHARRMDPGTVSPEIGVRLGADADEYLWNKAAEWTDGANAESRVREVGARWAAESGRESLQALLKELLARPDPPVGLRWLAEGAGLAP